MITKLIALFPFDSPFSPPSHLYLLPPPSLLYITLWISLGVPGCGEHLGNWLLPRSISLLLIPFSPPGHLYLLPPSSLLYGTLWTSLSVPDCGEQIGNWLLARLLSPLLIPSFSSQSPLSPSSLFSSPFNSVNLAGCPSLWESFHHLPRCFIITAVWMEKSWGYYKNKTETQRQED